MKSKWILAAVAGVVMLQAAGTANAFDCPNRFDAAQAAIDETTASMKGMMGKMDKADSALVHALLDDAKMMLAGAKHNHAKPQGTYDHARSIAKAEAARGSAEAAGILNAKYMAK